MLYSNDATGAMYWRSNGTQKHSIRNVCTVSGARAATVCLLMEKEKGCGVVSHFLRFWIVRPSKQHDLGTGLNLACREQLFRFWIDGFAFVN